jgi:hypothetical protein
MPMHDWTRVTAGDFHDFHQSWTVNIKARLNSGVLPANFYALVERVSGQAVPDVLTLHEQTEPSDNPAEFDGAVAVATAPPKVAVTGAIESLAYAKRKNRIVVRHEGSNRVVAMIEVVSSGNKANERDFRQFLAKVVSAIEQGIHVLVIDPYPPTKRDPHGIHGEIWAELGDDSYRAPPRKPLTMASYLAGSAPECFVEPLAVGDELAKMPLFLNPDYYVPVPLEETYALAFDGEPAHLKALLNAA